MANSAIRRITICAVFLLICCGAAYACQGTLLVTGITDEEKTLILAEHNRLRQLVANGRYPGQPGAENMREIVWDDELAARAQKWAENCQFRHDPHRTINRFTMGQNLAIIWSTAPLEPDDGDFPSRIKNWFNEVQKYSFGDAWSPKTGHYSQLVWGETSLVGCGFSEYKDSTKYNKLYVCNYGPGGNVVGYNPYEVGQPACGSYGMRPSSRYQGLCAAPGLANSLNSNSIETYEYTHTNNYNTQNTKNTQNTHTNTNTNTYAQTATNPYYPSSSSSSKQASNNGYKNTHTTSYGGSYAFSTAAQQANRRYSSVSTAAAAAAAASENSNYNNNNPYKYKNKLEAYKPSKTEFQTAIRKHTILRTYINSSSSKSSSSSSSSSSRSSSSSNSSNNNKYQTQVTQPPINKGWSLLSWRG